jgi:hypothetical protein
MLGGAFKAPPKKMRKKIYILVLLFISTGYLFSQTDTSVVEVNPKKEKADFVKYDFYNDYLPSIKTDTSIIGTSEFIPETGEMGVMFSARVGIGTFLVGGSVTVDFPVIDTIIYKLNISSNLHVDISGGTILGLGLGYVPIKTKTNNFILKLNLRPCIAMAKGNGGFFLNIGTDFIYKSISISPDIFIVGTGGSRGFPLIMLSFGINHKY